jgi:lipid A 3-O-deacylase
MVFTSPDGEVPVGAYAQPATFTPPARSAMNGLYAASNVAACALALMFALMSLLAMSPAAAADSLTPDGVALTGGNGNHVDVIGVAANWNFARGERAADQGGFDPRLVGQVSYWRGTQRPTEHGSLWDLSLMPVLRWTAPGSAAPRFFAEAGVGVHLLTATRINNERIFSTAFQFGEQAGGGFSFGPEHRYEIGAYLQHVSNAGIKKPNDGLTYVGVVFRIATR